MFINPDFGIQILQLKLFNMKKLKTISIGIPTYEAGLSLVYTLQSIYKQTMIDHIKNVYVVVDGRKISKSILKQIHHPKLKVIHFVKRKGQAARINDLFNISNSDLLILSNDDVLFEENTVKNVLSFKEKFDLMTSRLTTIHPHSFFERIIHTGKKINDFVSLNWKSADNYLCCNGRLVILSKRLYKRMSIPEKIWNNDAYMFLYSKIHKFRVVNGENIKAAFKLPSNLNEHLNQSNKFQKSYSDNQRYFSEDILSYYKIPNIIKIRGLLYEFKQSPIYTSLYIVLLIYTRFKGRRSNIQHSRGFWKTDKSTKILYRSTNI